MNDVTIKLLQNAFKRYGRVALHKSLSSYGRDEIWIQDIHNVGMHRLTYTYNYLFLGVLKVGEGDSSLRYIEFGEDNIYAINDVPFISRKSEGTTCLEI